MITIGCYDLDIMMTYNTQRLMILRHNFYSKFISYVKSNDLTGERNSYQARPQLAVRGRLLPQ